MRGFAILLTFNICGVLLQSLFHIPMPGNVIGLILFVIALFTKVIKLEWVEASSQFLLRHMQLFFAPLIVGIVLFVPLFGQYWFSIAVSLIVSTCIVIMVSGWISHKLDTPQTEVKKHG